MKIYTGFGDEGKTRLFGGEVVDKDHLRIQVYGTLDELNSIIGMIVSAGSDTSLKKELNIIQDRLFRISADLATPQKQKKAVLDMKITDHDISYVERRIDAMDATLPVLKNFILPGGTGVASILHLARTVTRRAERHLISLGKTVTLDPAIRIFLNRLSDLFFVMARVENHRENIEDIPWVPDRESSKEP